MSNSELRAVAAEAMMKWWKQKQLVELITTYFLSRLSLSSFYSQKCWIFNTITQGNGVKCYIYMIDELRLIHLIIRPNTEVYIYLY